MLMAFSVVVLGILFFICIVNHSFQKTKYRNLPKEVIKKYSIFNSPGAWLLYSTIIGIAISVIVYHAFVNMITGYSDIGAAVNRSQQNNYQQSDSQ